MKRFLSMLSAIIVLVLTFPVNAFAVSDAKDGDIIYLNDGYYITVEVTEVQSRALNTKSGSKTYVCRDSSGNEDWRAVVTGTFAYTGEISYCTSYNCNVTITDSAWYTISKSSSKDGATAIGNVTMGCKLLGITIKEQSATIRLTCDKNGNLS